MLCARVMRGISSMAKSATPVLASAVETLGLRERIEHADDRRALLHGFDDLGAGASDGQHDIGIADGLGVGLGDLRAGRLVVLIGKVGAQPGASADCDARARLHELLDRLGREPDARLVFLFGGHANRDHRES